MENPLFTDKTTKFQTRIGYACVCVVVGVEETQLTNVPIWNCDGLWRQDLAFNWIPPIYKTSCHFGQKDKQCLKVATQDATTSSTKSRQGDPMSLQLFSLVMEGLSCLSRNIFKKPAST